MTLSIVSSAIVLLGAVALALPGPAAAGDASHLLVKLDDAGAALLEDASPGPSGTLETGLPSLDSLNRLAGVKTAFRSLAHVGRADPDGAIGLRRWFTLVLASGVDARRVAPLYAGSPHVERAHANLAFTEFVVPDDPLHPDHWGHRNTAQLPASEIGCPATCSLENGHCGAAVGTVGFDTGMEAAWDEAQGFGDSTVVVAVIDSGFDIDHPDIRFVQGWDFWDNDNNPDVDSNAHGTACAGVAAAIADNGVGAAGVAGGCSIMPMRALFAGDVADALMGATNNGASIVSMSFGYLGADSVPIVDDALTAAAAAGLLLVAASGNGNESQFWVPANHPDVMAVGAASPCGGRKTPATCDGETLWGSNYGSAVQDAADAIDVVAPTILPTTDILGAGGYGPEDYCVYFSGTSCATPYVAGLAALVKSAHPAWDAAQIRQAIVSTAIDIVDAESGVGWDRFTGYGMVSGVALTGPPVGVDASRDGPAIALRVRPNPSRGHVVLEFPVAAATPYSLRVVDVRGRVVRDFAGVGTGGWRRVEWDGRDRTGRRVAAGTYVLQLRADGLDAARKIVRLDPR